MKLQERVATLNNEHRAVRAKVRRKVSSIQRKMANLRCAVIVSAGNKIISQCCRSEGLACETRGVAVAVSNLSESRNLCSHYTEAKN